MNLGIEFNLLAYLKSVLPALNYVTNGLQGNTPNDCVQIDSTGGMDNHYHDRNDYTVKILVRAEDKFDCRTNAYEVYNAINEKFGLTLPEETVGSTTFPAIKTWRIVSTMTPTSLGSDESGRHLFLLNFIITTD